MKLTRILIFCTAVGLAGCEQSIEGRYQDANGVTVYEFSPPDRVFATALGVTVQGHYRISGDQVFVTTPQGTLVLTRRNDALLTTRGILLAPVPANG